MYSFIKPDKYSLLIDTPGKTNQNVERRLLERVLLKVNKSKFDFDGWNLNWKTIFSNDERILLKKFICNSAV